MRASAMPVQTLVKPQRAVPKERAESARDLGGQLGWGPCPKKSDPAYLAVSRVSLGRGYLVVRVRWTESPSGVRVFNFFR